VFQGFSWSSYYIYSINIIFVKFVGYFTKIYQITFPVEIVDTLGRLEKFLHKIDDSIEGGMATLEKAQVRFYRKKNGEE